MSSSETRSSARVTAAGRSTCACVAGAFIANLLDAKAEDSTGVAGDQSGAAACRRVLVMAHGVTAAQLAAASGDGFAKAAPEASVRIEFP